MSLTESIDDLRRYARAERRRREIVERTRAENSLYEFVKLMWHTVEPSTPFVSGWVLEGWCEHLEAVTDGRVTRVLGNVPPGTTKSLVTDVFWPAWEWGPRNMPHLRYLCTAYASHLTERDNRRFRQVVTSDVYQRHWGQRFALVGESVGLITNDKTGWKLASSVGGISTGERADRVIMDDPNRPPTDEDGGETSSVMRATAVWFREVMPDRLNNLKDSAIVVIQQRLAEIDVSGTILALGLAPVAEEWEPGDYVHYMVPMEYDPLRHCETVLGWSDPRGLDENGERLEGLVQRGDGRVELDPNSELAERDGEIAWPERFDEQALSRLKQLKGPFGWAGQYQQRPAPREGGIIKEDQWQLWQGEDFPPFGTCIASLDTAYKENESADYNALTVWAAFAHPDNERPKIMLRGAWQVRSSLSELVKKVVATCREHKADTLLIEDKTRGGDVADEIYRLIGRREIRIVLVDVNRTDKVSRLEAVEPLFANGMIYAPDREWAQMVIDQVSTFPRGRHDDLCFAAGTRIATKRGSVPIERVVVGDLVVTPLGWRRVTASAMTGMHETCRARGLQGTPKHPVYTLDEGYCCLYSINSQSLISELTLCGLIRLILPKKWNSWVSSTVAWEGSGDIIYRNRHLMLGDEAQGDCTSPFGNTIMARFLMGMRSTIKTTIRLIVILGTWSAYRKACIADILRFMTWPINWPILSVSGRLLRNGIDHLTGANGINIMLPKVSENREPLNPIHWSRQHRWNVNGAASSIPHCDPKRLGFAVRRVALRVTRLSEGITKRFTLIMRRVMGYRVPVSANGAVMNFRLEKAAAARVNSASSVVRRHISDISTELRQPYTRILQPVYNLTVEDAGCYYANGVLVHNCDTVSQALGYLRKTGVALRREEHDDMVRERRMFRKQVKPVYDV